MRISIDSSFFFDPRITVLAKILDEPRGITESRLLRIWHRCYEKKSSNLCSKEVGLYSDSPGSNLASGIIIRGLIESDLVEDLGNDEYRIKGVSDRIEFMTKQLERANKRWKKDSQNNENSGIIDECQRNANAMPTHSEGNTYSKTISKTTTKNIINTPNGVLSSAVQNDDQKPPISLDNDQSKISNNNNNLKEVKASIDNFVAIYNSFAKIPMPKCSKVSADRRKHIKARLADEPDLDYWTKVIQRISESNFCTGDNNNGWVASIDFVIRPDTHIKVMEGKYDNLKKKQEFTYKATVDKIFDKLEKERENERNENGIQWDNGCDQ